MSRAGGSSAGRPAANPTGDVYIDRLALRVTGLRDDAAHALARHVAEGLAPGILLGPLIGGLDHLRIDVKADHADAGNPELLASTIVQAVGSALARGRVSGSPDGEAIA